MRCKVALGLIALLAANAANACEINGKKDGVPNLIRCPTVISDFTARAVTCQHFAGEFGGDGSLRDKEVFAEITKLKCDKLKADHASITKKYASNVSVMKVLQKTIDDYAIELY